VPLSVAESYVAAHPRVRLVRLTGVGHFAPIDPLSASWPAVLDELAGAGAARCFAKNVSMCS
jgi:hypothetical protein